MVYFGYRKRFDNAHGGIGRYGLESDNKLVDSAILLTRMNGEHLGTTVTTIPKWTSSAKVQMLSLNLMLDLIISSSALYPKLDSQKGGV